MTSTILVTGGTGTLGQLFVPRLREAGCKDIRVLTRGSHQDRDGVRFVTGDLAKGQGLDAAVEGATTIVHCASASKGDAEATRNLMQAASRSGGSPHLVYTSIVGVDLVTFGYFGTKLASEGVVADSGLPWTMLRITQFYDLLLKGAQKVAKMPLAPIPSGFRVQPVDPDEVAARLVELTLGEPAGRVPDMAGPRATDAVELIREYMRITNRRRKVMPVWMPGLGKIRAGGLMVPEGDLSPEHQGKGTWEEFLHKKLKSA
ncbi:SDR family oxidoreductase [Streptomyces sp. N2-109]|uniref:SDR family oxidoreductase n=1 Tax=Streptomyces gossypii TaxID=2883101 RepID=A0ABT2JKP0_9ACTN|nr:SDR family oxidoreductase [Streptomyces gossypii]MCT2588442.1 SDR family oxidoreductase [Streptomyces gossypii]